MRVTSITLFAAVVLLGGCSHYSNDMASLEGKIGTDAPLVTAYNVAPQEIAPAAGGPVSMEVLNKSLAREYLAMAKFENDKAFDYKAAKQYTEKAKRASDGQVVGPFKISSFDVPSSKVGPLKTARAELINALKTQNTPENQATLAKAQARFDCWVEREEEAADEIHCESCKGEFEQAMAMLIAPAAGDALPPTVYDITFAQNSTLLDPASKNALNYIASYLNAPANAAYSATVTGLTGTTQGEQATNIANARVMAVRDALVAKGIDGSRLSPLISGATEGQPRVQIALVSPQGAANPNVTTTTTYVPVTPVQVPVTPAR